MESIHIFYFNEHCTIGTDEKFNVLMINEIMLNEQPRGQITEKTLQSLLSKVIVKVL